MVQPRQNFISCLLCKLSSKDAPIIPYVLQLGVKEVMNEDGRDGYEENENCQDDGVWTM